MANEIPVTEFLQPPMWAIITTIILSLTASFIYNEDKYHKNIKKTFKNMFNKNPNDFTTATLQKAIKHVKTKEYNKKEKELFNKLNEKEC